MSFEAKAIRHGAILVGPIPIARVIAACPRQQRTHPQQRKVEQHEAGIRWNRGEALDRRFCLSDIRRAPPLQKRLHQNAGRRSKRQNVTYRVKEFERSTCHINCTVDIAEPCFLLRYFGVGPPNGVLAVSMADGCLAISGESLEAIRTMRTARVCEHDAVREQGRVESEVIAGSLRDAECFGGLADRCGIRQQPAVVHAHRRLEHHRCNV